MKDLLAAIRSGEVGGDRRRVHVVGFDPDVSVMGWARVSADIGGGLPIQHINADLEMTTYRDLMGKDARKGKQQAYDVVAGLAKHIALANALHQAHIVIESQDFYPDPDSPRPKMVSQANALIMCSHVSGGVHMLARLQGVPPLVAQPSAWKGNRSKDADHHRSMALLEKSRCIMWLSPGVATFTATTDRLKGIPAIWEHALDGLGLALYGIEQLHRGTWKP